VPTRAEPFQIGQISLRQNENGLCAGGTQVGKSTLSDVLWRDFLHRYYSKGARVHISDTKPRYRAEFLPNGRKAAHLYKKWGHGPTVKGSVLVETPADMDLAWQLGYRITICQSKRWSEKQDVCLNHFDEESKRGRPQLAVIDETKHHFYGNGMPRGTGALINIAQAGNERGGGGLYCTQRTQGIAPELLEHMRRLYAFRMDNVKDAKRFQEFGAPPFVLPTTPHRFKYWNKYDYYRVWGPYNLTLNNPA
jgi:hypothetical protein